MTRRTPRQRLLPAFQRLRERAGDTWVIHADNASFDATLCGYAYEGTCIEGDGDSGVTEVARGKINCADCLRIIWHCQGIPKRVLAERGPLVKVKRRE